MGSPSLSVKSRSLAGKGNQGYVVLEAARPCDPGPSSIVDAYRRVCPDVGH